MRCPVCGAWSEVLATRQAQGVTKRTRLCGNNHRFPTYEVWPNVVFPRSLNAHLRMVEQATIRWKRDTEIRRSPLSTAELAKQYGLSEVQIRTIRRAGRKPAQPKVNRK